MPGGRLRHRAGAVGVVLLVAAAAVRWLVPAARVPAALVALGVVAARVVVGAVDAARGRQPWSKLFLPALIGGELVLVMVGRASLGAAIAVVGGAELVLIVVTVVALVRGPRATGPWPQRVEAALSKIFPPVLARFASVELAVLAAAVSAPFGRAAAPEPGVFGSFKDSPLRWMPILLVMTMPGDILLVHVLLGRTLGFVSWVITGSGVYALLWIIGLGATIRRRPHRVTGDSVELHRGVLGSAQFPRADVVRVTVLGTLTGRQRRARAQGAAQLGLAGTQLLEIELRHPALVQTALGTAQSARILVSADDPEGMKQALLGLPRVPAGPPAGMTTSGSR